MMQAPILKIAAAAALLLLVACSSGPGLRATVDGAALPPPDTSGQNATQMAGSDYRVGPEDVLEVTVFGVPDLSRTVRVNATGQITLPLVGSVQAGGLTIPALESEIAKDLSKSYLQNPQVSVFVKEFASQRITMEGALSKPGIYPITGRTTLLQAVAIAGGMDKLARTSNVVLFREIKGRRMAAVFDMGKISSGESPDPQVYGGDVVVVPKSGAKTTLENVIRASPLIGLFFLY